MGKIVNGQRIIALAFLVTIGVMILYVALIDSLFQISVYNKSSQLWDEIYRPDRNLLLRDIKTYIGLISIGLGLFIYAGKWSKNE